MPLFFQSSRKCLLLGSLLYWPCSVDLTNIDMAWVGEYPMLLQLLERSKKLRAWTLSPFGWSQNPFLATVARIHRQISQPPLHLGVDR